MTVTVKHSKTNAITDWTQAQLDEQIALGNFAPGTTLANIVLPSDWNNDHTLTGVGTMAEQNANSVAITGGSVNGTTIGATTASTGRFSDLTDTGLTSGRVTYATTGGNLTDSANLTFNGTTLTTTAVTTPSVTATTTDLTLSAISTGVVNVNTLAGKAFSVTDHPFTAGGSNVNFTRAFGGQTGYSTGIMAQGTDGTVVLAQSSKGATSVQFFTSSFGTQQFNIAHTASAVNYVQVTGSSTGTRPSLTVAGSDATIGLNIAAKGGEIVFLNNGVGTNAQFSTTFTASSVNYLSATGSGATGNAPRLYAQGSDTNISMAFQPKGTGAIDLAAGSSGVNISNGGTVTAITRTSNGSGYTSVPSVAITAPTTAGGVQATATCTVGTNAFAVSAGGTGYTVGDTLTVVGGTGTAATFTVATLSGSAVATVTAANAGSYSVVPTNPVSTTGGTGSGCTINITGYSVTSGGFTITNAGSGYIEQPTVTFSGGGGSGAAAYATVGSATTLRHIGGFHSFTGPSGISFAINSASGTVANYVQASSQSTGNYPNIAAAGTDAAVGLDIFSKGATPVRTRTGTGGATQFQVSDTASAVNYVQVTGAATTGTPIVQAQGSDANVSLAIRAKGGGNLFFQPNSLNQFAVIQTASAVNYLQATGSAAGSAPAFSVAGTDTNIDLALTPKGTGNVRFGTYTASMALTVQGYIEIKDSGGTIRRLAVVT
jgi:hypothetical protein